MEPRRALLSERLAPENAAITFVKSLGGVGFRLSASSSWETFSVDVPLSEFVTTSEFVAAYGTHDHSWNPDVDYEDEKGLQPLYAGRKGGERQGWWVSVDVSDWYEVGLVAGEAEEDVSKRIADAFAESTEAAEAIYVFRNPDTVGNYLYGSTSGAYVFSGRDPQTGRLVGFMTQNVTE